MVPSGYSIRLLHTDNVYVLMYCMYNNGRRLDVNSVAIDRLLKYDECSYTDRQVYGYTLKANSDYRPFSHCFCACVYRSRDALFLDNRRDFT